MKYTVKEASKILGITPRVLQIRCKKAGIKKEGRSYIIDNTALELLKNESNEVNEAKRNEVNEANEYIEEQFTSEEYDKLQELIKTHPLLLKRLEEYKEEIQFLREELQEKNNRLDKQSLQLDNIIEALNGSIKTTQQQNYIEAKNKGYE